MIKNVKIIGLGLMGANLGINLINKGINVYGQDINHDVEKRAEKYGINVGSNIQNYDITILSMPINNIITFLSREHQDDKSDLIIDIGGILLWFIYMLVMESHIPKQMGNMIILFGVMLSLGIFLGFNFHSAVASCPIKPSPVVGEFIGQGVPANFMASNTLLI